MDFTVTKVTTPDEISKIEEFLHDNFHPDMPLTIAFCLENSPPPRSPGPPPEGSEDFYLKAVDIQGDTIGVAVNRVHVTFTTDTESPPEIIKVMEFMKFIEKEAELNRLPERTIELRVLSVRKDWRQRGVAKRLAEESVKVARDCGFKAMRICCTSEFTAKLVRSLGWKEHYSLAYKNYPKVSRKEVYLKPTPPHDYIYYYVTKL